MKGFPGISGTPFAATNRRQPENNSRYRSLWYQIGESRQYVSFTGKTAMSSHAPIIYPGAIARALSAIDECAQLKTMPDSYIRVLIRILKKINLKKPDSAIFASRQTLADESGKSIETVHRAIKWLEDHELIEREQKAHTGLRGSSSPLVITRKLLDALLISDRSHHHKAPVTEITPVITEAAQQRTQDQFERVSGFTLPKDLAWLTRRGMKPTGVLQLMKMAKQAQQHLSDVVHATRQYLDGLDGRALYAYLRALLSKGLDFSQRAREVDQTARDSQATEFLKLKSEALEGRSFVKKDGSLIVRVESGMLIEVRNGKRSARPMCQGFLDAIDSGRLTARDCG